MIASRDAKNEREIWKVGTELSSGAEFPSQLSPAQLGLSLHGWLQVGTGDDSTIQTGKNGEKYAPDILSYATHVPQNMNN